MLRAAVFDVDGTLVDTADLHARAWQDAFRKWGKDVDFVAAVRKQFPQILLSVDANSAYSLTDAEWLKRLDEVELLMIV